MRGVGGVRCGDSGEVAEEEQPSGETLQYISGKWGFAGAYRVFNGMARASARDVLPATPSAPLAVEGGGCSVGKLALKFL